MDYKYRVEYSSRKTVSVEVTPSGTVLLRVPKGTSAGTIEYILQKSEKEIEAAFRDMEETKKYAAEADAAEKTAAENGLCEKSFFFCGREIKYKIMFGNADKFGIKINPDRSVIVFVPEDYSVWEAMDYVERHKRWIVNRLGELDSLSDACCDDDEEEKVFDLCGRKIPYKVEFSSKKSFSVEFCNPDLSLVVHAPYGTPPDVIEDVLTQNRDGLASRLSDLESRREGFEDVLNYSKILVSGEKYTYYNAFASKITRDRVYSNGLEGLMHVYVAKFGQSFTKMVREVAKRLGVTMGRVEFRSYRKDWGRCADGVNFVFNYKLLMLPVSYQEFVVAYLMCVFSDPGKSQDFWERLEAAVPGSKSMYDSIGRFGFILSLYP